MKKLMTAIKRPTPSPAADETEANRVTNETVSQHRDAILSNARRFKYPFQRSKHRIVLISLLVVALALGILGAITGLQLYRWQSTSVFTYRVTQVLPFPVAKINGATTSYESYLFELRSSVHWQEKYGTTDLRSEDGRRQIEYLKRSALDKALTTTIARSFANQNDVTVQASEVDDVVARIKASGGNLDQILGESFDFTETELRRYIKDNILRQKVAKKLDIEAPKRAAAALAKLRAGAAFGDIAKESSDDLETKQLGGDFGVIERGYANLPAEVSDKAFQLQAGETSDVIATSSDYYIIKVNEKVDENRLKVAVIRIKVKDMTQYLKDYRDQSKLKEYIKLQQQAQ